MVSHRTKRILRYLGPFLFFVGLAYTALYPERKLLHYANQEEKATTLFNSGSVTVKDEISLASCRVSELCFVILLKKNLSTISIYHYYVVTCVPISI